MIDETMLITLAREIGLPLSPQEAAFYQQRLTYFLPYIEMVEHAGEAE